MIDFNGGKDKRVPAHATVHFVVNLCSVQDFFVICRIGTVRNGTAAIKGLSGKGCQGEKRTDILNNCKTSV